MKLLEHVLRSLNDHKEKGRYLCEMFQELPVKEEYPDYYQVIKKPIAIENIEEKLETEQYKNIDQMRNDVEQMVKNAMIYNKKGSAIYRDASLIITVFDEYTQSFESVKKIASQCKKFLSAVKAKVCPQTLKIIRNVDVDDALILKDIEKRLQNLEYADYGDFQGDFEVIITELQDEHEEEEDVVKDCEFINELFVELSNDDDGGSAAKDITGSVLESLNLKNEIYKLGDCVYIANADIPTLPTIGQIYHIWSTKDGNNQGVTVSWFLRPEQTVHKLMTKFIKNEVFKTNHYENYLDSEIVGRCSIMHVKDYIRGKLTSGADKDIFVCESRYNLETKSSIQIKSWKLSIPEEIRDSELNLQLYEEPKVIFRLPLESELPLGVMPSGSKRKRDIEDDVDSPGLKRGRPILTNEKITNQSPLINNQARSSRELNQNLKSQFFLPTPTATTLMSAETVTRLDLRGDGTVRWFPTPPLDVIDHDPIAHSQVYIEYLKTHELMEVDTHINTVDVEKIEIGADLNGRNNDNNVGDKLSSREDMMKALKKFDDAIFT